LYHIGCVIFDTRHTKKTKKIYERKIASRLEGCSYFEGFQTLVHIKGCLGGIYSVHNVQAFHVIVTIWCGELELADSRFHYHIHRQIHFVCFTCKTDGKLLFLIYPFF